MPISIKFWLEHLGVIDKRHFLRSGAYLREEIVLTLVQNGVALIRLRCLYEARVLLAHIKKVWTALKSEQFL